MSFPFTNDSVAHYRSPDVGAAVKELGGVKIDPKNLEIQLMVAGYKDIRLTTLPRANHGAVELNFAMEPTGTGAGQPAAGGPADAESQSSNLPVQSPWAQPIAYGSVGLVHGRSDGAYIRPPSVAQTIEAAVEPNRTARADVPLERLAVIADRLDQVVRPLLVKPQSLPVARNDAEQPLDVRIGALRHLLDVR